MGRILRNGPGLNCLEILPTLFGDGGAEVTLIRDRDGVSQLPKMPENQNLSIGYCHLCHCDGEKVVTARNGSF